MRLQILNFIRHVLFPRSFPNISRTAIPQNASSQQHLKALKVKNQAK